MIIEFLGVSGVGKTTLAKNIVKQLEEEGIRVIWDTYELYENYNWLLRNFKKGIEVIKFTLTHSLWVKEYKNFLWKQTIPDKSLWQLLFNAVFLKKLFVKAREDQMVHVFDEGVFQHLSAIKLRGNYTVTKQDLDDMEFFFGYPSLLIVVVADIDIIVQRIKTRGRYVHVMDGGNLWQSVNKMQSIQNDIVNGLDNEVKILVLKNN